MAHTNALSTKIIVGTRTYGVALNNRREKAGKGRVWLFPQDSNPFEANWPMRLHGETYYEEIHN